MIGGLGPLSLYPGVREGHWGDYPLAVLFLDDSFSALYASVLIGVTRGRNCARWACCIS